MALKKNSILLTKLEDWEIKLLEEDIAKRKSVSDVVVKMLERYLGGTGVSLDDPNWALRRARKDGQDEIIKVLKNCIGE